MASTFRWVSEMWGRGHDQLQVMEEQNRYLSLEVDNDADAVHLHLHKAWISIGISISQLCILCNLTAGWSVTLVREWKLPLMVTISVFGLSACDIQIGA